MSRCFDVHTSTPWGRADIATRFARGITFYNTPGHGGFKLSKGLNERIPEDFRNESWSALGKQGWYEEDCDANIVIVHFPEHFSKEQVAAAHEALATYMPVTYAKYFTCSEPIQEGDASMNVSLARQEGRL